MGDFRDAISRDAERRAIDQARCKAVKIGDQLEADDRVLYLELLDKHVREIGHLWLMERLRDASVEPPSLSTIRRHREGRCLCHGFHHGQTRDKD